MNLHICQWTIYPAILLKCHYSFHIRLHILHIMTSFVPREKTELNELVLDFAQYDELVVTLRKLARKLGAPKAVLVDSIFEQKFGYTLPVMYIPELAELPPDDCVDTCSALNVLIGRHFLFLEEDMIYFEAQADIWRRKEDGQEIAASFDKKVADCIKLLRWTSSWRRLSAASWRIARDSRQACELNSAELTVNVARADHDKSLASHKCQTAIGRLETPPRKACTPKNTTNAIQKYAPPLTHWIQSKPSVKALLSGRFSQIILKKSGQQPDSWINFVIFARIQFSKIIFLCYASEQLSLLRHTTNYSTN